MHHFLYRAKIDNINNKLSSKLSKKIRPITRVHQPVLYSFLVKKVCKVERKNNQKGYELLLLLVKMIDREATRA